MNNLYGWAMSSCFPHGGFKYLKNVDNFDVKSISENSLIRYILEVDLEYPEKLHVSFNDYPLAPEKLAIPYEILSGYCKKIVDEYEIKVSEVKKIIWNLGNKTNYVLYYRNLQLSLSLGMNMTKIHRVLKFKQSDWMKISIFIQWNIDIDFNTKKRTNAANNFQKEFVKLTINSVYGKTMESLRKSINVRLVNNKKDFLKYTSRPTHITHKIFGKNYAAIYETKPVLTLSKSIYVRFLVLKFKKWLMYDFHYSFIRKHFDTELLFTDTNILTYEIKSEDVYEDFFKHKHLFDFNNYLKDTIFLWSG